MYRKLQIFILQCFLALLKKYERLHGFHETVKKILLVARAHIITSGLNDLLVKTLTMAPAIVVANHPTSASVLALIASLPTRKDIYLVINSKFVGYCPPIDEHLIPVYINHHFSKNGPRYSYALPEDEEHRRNIESIKRAADVVNAGGVVVIFPGYPEKNNKWYSGIGYLLKQVKKLNAHVIPIYVQEKSSLGYIRLIPFIGAILPPVLIHFAPPIKVADIVEQDAKIIASKLESEFRAFAESK